MEPHHLPKLQKTKEEQFSTQFAISRGSGWKGISRAISTFWNGILKQSYSDWNSMASFVKWTMTDRLREFSFSSSHWKSRTNGRTKIEWVVQEIGVIVRKNLRSEHYSTNANPQTYPGLKTRWRHFGRRKKSSAK